ncbi:hypothetical protein OHB04_24780 [Streptomyces sp. NBC_01775]|uniref:hypothetical protein n=1 Tax=Streptomyces sp. NBC_01775 TaxID=2975939 RepID=UPI002DD98A0C|nr:hypothetical protein [Streptomyces sp. NBC_01775]WSB78657.1 hypothetical protein OHB04_24780 [Streptomyces sp. NBC_01775]
MPSSATPSNPGSNTELRLLPWSTPEGKPCYLSADPDGDGLISELADQLEERQLDEATELLLVARSALTQRPDNSVVQVHTFAVRLCAALRDAVRVAESRGGRLGQEGGREGALTSGGGR